MSETNKNNLVNNKKFMITRKLTDYKLSDNINKDNLIIISINNLVATYALKIINSQNKFNQTQFIKLLNQMKNIKDIGNKNNMIITGARNELRSLFESSNYDITIINNEYHITNNTITVNI